MIRTIFMFMILLPVLSFDSVCAAEIALPEEEISKTDAVPDAELESEEIVSPKTASDLVVVRVSGEPITEKQVQDAINEIAWEQETLTIEQARMRNSLFFSGAVENLITLSLLKARMLEMNVTVEEADVDVRLQQLSQRFPTPEVFQESLAAQGMTEDTLRNNQRENLRLQKILDEASKNAASVTDEDVEAFYANNPERFATKDRAHVAHILLKIPPDVTATQKEEIRKKLEAIRVDIEAEIITFAEAALKYSQDESTAENGGDLGIMIRDNMPESFANAIFYIKQRTVSPALESQSGYHILKALELHPAGQSTLEEVKPVLRQLLEQNAKQSAMKNFVEELKGRATIEHFMTAEEFVRRNR